MLTKEQVLEAVKTGRESQCFDCRDYARLLGFFGSEDFATFGFELTAGAEHAPDDWARETVLAQLGRDVNFGFNKALNKRGLSAGMMNAVVRMWLWVLEDELQHSEEYAQYGLPLLKAVAIKYGFPNPIGPDRGDEFEYSDGTD